MYEDLKRQAEAYIRTHLKKSRYEHTLRVVREALVLADRFGADPHKAEIAALLHDAAKNLTIEEMNRQVVQYGLDPDRYLNRPNLAHSKLGMWIAADTFGIDDPDVLTAIAYHTTGRAGMSTLEKVIFLADGIEPGRSYPSVEEIRSLATEDLDAACLAMLQRTIGYLRKKKEPIDSDTLNAYQDLRKEHTL